MSIFLENVSITFIDKTDPSSPLKTNPLKGENHLRSTRKMVPWGKNVRTVFEIAFLFILATGFV